MAFVTLMCVQLINLPTSKLFEIGKNVYYVKSFLPHIFMCCEGIVFTHGIWMGGQVLHGMGGQTGR